MSSNRGEFGLIEYIKELVGVPDGVVGIGDDCAVIPVGDEELIVTTDMLVEGVHFLRSDATPEQVGHKALAVNLSDIAAMGGEATAIFLSLALPADAQGEWAERFMEGFAALARRWGVQLLGGDTTGSLRDVTVNVTVVGKCPRGKALLRSGARVGDVIYVTGPLGDSGGGLRAILQGGERNEQLQKLVERHYSPSPRLSEGAAILHSNLAHAMMDISDGIASDLGHILKASGVGAEVEIYHIPISAELRDQSRLWGWNEVELATSAGEDFELLVVGDDTLPQAVDFPLYPIGRIVAGKGDIVWLRNSERVEFDTQGFRHF